MRQPCRLLRQPCRLLRQPCRLLRQPAGSSPVPSEASAEHLCLVPDANLRITRELMPDERIRSVSWRSVDGAERVTIDEPRANKGPSREGLCRRGGNLIPPITAPHARRSRRPPPGRSSRRERTPRSPAGPYALAGDPGRHPRTRGPSRPLDVGWRHRSVRDAASGIAADPWFPRGGLSRWDRVAGGIGKPTRAVAPTAGSNGGSGGGFQRWARAVGTDGGRQLWDPTVGAGGGILRWARAVGSRGGLGLRMRLWSGRSGPVGRAGPLYSGRLSSLHTPHPPGPRRAGVAHAPPAGGGRADRAAPPGPQPRPPCHTAAPLAEVYP